MGLLDTIKNMLGMGGEEAPAVEEAPQETMEEQPMETPTEETSTEEGAEETKSEF